MNLKNLHFGHGIFLAMLIFALWMFTYVYRALNTNVEMADDRPYEQGLAWDTVMAHRRNVQRLPQQPTVTLRIAPLPELQLLAPALAPAAQVSGALQLEHLANSRLDTTIPLQLDSTYRQQIPFATFRPGSWRALLQWRDGQHAYRWEERFVLPKP